MATSSEDQKLVGTENEPLILQTPQESVQDQDIGESQPPSTSPKKDPHDTNLRWFVLALSIITNYGAYFANDNPQALQSHIQQIFSIRDTEFNLMYGMSILPNSVVPFFGGIVTDTLGVGFTMIFTGLLVLIGQAIITAGAAMYNFHILLIGRFIFGCGYQTLENTLLIMITKWFLTHELTLAWGLARTCLRTATALNSFLSSRLYSWTGRLYVPFLVSFVINAVSVLCIFIVVYIDKKAEKSAKSPISVKPSSRVSIRDLKNLPRLYYLILVIGVLVYTAFFGFTNNVNNLLVTRFGFTPESAGTVIMCIYLTAATLSPFVGLLIDRIARRTLFLFAASIVLFLTELYFAVLEDATASNPNYNVVFGLVGFGIFYSMFSTTFWTSIPLIVAPQAVGTAIGIVTAGSSLALTFYTETLGIIHDSTLDSHQGYYWTQISHCIVVGIVILFVIWTYVEDITTKKTLYNPRKKAEEKVE